MGRQNHTVLILNGNSRENFLRGFGIYRDRSRLSAEIFRSASISPPTPKSTVINCFSKLEAGNRGRVATSRATARPHGRT
jgi:hypothetical protein